MSFQELLIISGVMVALAAVRFGVPILCTWGICWIVRHFTPQA